MTDCKHQWNKQRLCMICGALRKDELPKLKTSDTIKDEYLHE